MRVVPSAAGLWRRAEGDNEVAMGACEKLRVAAASLCVLATVEEVRVGRERALDRQRVADLEAMIVVCRLCCWSCLGRIYKCSVRSRKVDVSPYSAMTPLPLSLPRVKSQSTNLSINESNNAAHVPRDSLSDGSIINIFFTIDAHQS